MSLSKCSVCIDPETSDNRILTCACGLKAHMMCYGVEKFSEQWKCSPCKVGLYTVKCELCLKMQGAFKATLCHRWVHVICALFTEGVVFKDTNTMEPIDISIPLAKKEKKRCDLCFEKIGVCCQCAQKDCDNMMHITCAQSYDCLQELIDPVDNTIQFLTFCFDHKPLGSSSRRISANFVREKLSKKFLENTIDESAIETEFHPMVSSTHLGQFDDLEMLSNSGSKVKSSFIIIQILFLPNPFHSVLYKTQSKNWAKPQIWIFCNSATLFDDNLYKNE